MYDDGVGGTNGDCTSAGQSGCWGHRDGILVNGSGTMGVAGLNAGNYMVFAGLFVRS